MEEFLKLAKLISKKKAKVKSKIDIDFIWKLYNFCMANTFLFVKLLAQSGFNICVIFYCDIRPTSNKEHISRKIDLENKK